ncbi:MAG: UPF0175 family protein [Acidobacteriota bacterium]
MEAVGDRERRSLARELQQLWLLEEVRKGRLSTGRAAALAQLTVAEFLALMHDHGISPFNYEIDELADELA